MVDLSYKINKNINAPGKGVLIEDDVEFPPCVAVNCAVAGALTVTWLDDSTSTFYFVQGSGNILQIKKVGSGAEAASLVALYNT